MADRNEKTIVLHSLNENNHLIDKSIIQAILRKYSVDTPIKNIKLYQTALVHSSYSLDDAEHTPADEDPLTNVKNVVPFQQTSSECLEFIGDSILGAVVTHYLATRYPETREGWLTTTKGKLVCSKGLYHLAKEIGLEQHILMSKEFEEKGGRNNRATLEDAFESLIGALFTDIEPDMNDISDLKKSNGSEGFRVCQQFIVNVLESAVDFAHVINHDSNYKHKLMRHYQTHFNGAHPKYVSITDANLGTGKRFKEGVYGYDGTSIIGYGVSNKKTHAQQLASKNALMYLGEHVDSDSESDAD